MKASICILFLLVLTTFLQAGHDSVVDIVTITADTTPVYKLNNKPMKVAEIEAWLQDEMKKPDASRRALLVRPDERTAFTTVFDLLERLKASGVKRFEVIVSSKESKGFLDRRFLIATAEDVQFRRVRLPIDEERKAVLKEAEVIELARTAADKQGYKLENFDAPKAHYYNSDEDDVWWVFYQGKLRRPGNFFSVSVNDKTKKIDVFEGE